MDQQARAGISDPVEVLEGRHGCGLAVLAARNADGDGRAVLVFNGEIYNYRELRAELRTLGAEFRTDGDSEVILAAAQRYWQTVLGIVLCGAAYGLAWVQNAALIVDIYPKEKQPLILGGVFVATSVGSLLGPSWGAGAWSTCPGGPSSGSCSL